MKLALIEDDSLITPSFLAHFSQRRNSLLIHQPNCYISICSHRFDLFEVENHLSPVRMTEDFFGLYTIISLSLSRYLSISISRSPFFIQLSDWRVVVVAVVALLLQNFGYLPMLSLRLCVCVCRVCIDLSPPLQRGQMSIERHCVYQSMGQIATCFRGPSLHVMPPTPPPLCGDNSSDRWSSDWSACDEGPPLDTDLWASLGGPADIPFASQYIDEQLVRQSIRVANQKTETFYSDVCTESERRRRVQFADKTDLVTIICDVGGQNISRNVVLFSQIFRLVCYFIR